jgi:hypothetical protein
MTVTHLICPYFFDRPINPASYTEACLIPQLRDRWLMEVVWLLQDGAPAHFALTMCASLNKHYLGRWIGRGSPSPTPLSWPLCSLHPTTPDNYLWGIIKGQVASCTQPWNRHSPSICHKCFGACRTEHGSASGCVSNTTLHIQIHLMYSDPGHLVC